MSVGNNGSTIIFGYDDLDIRNYLETALRCQRYSVEVAQNGEEILAHLRGRQAPLSAVVLDVIMPGRDGIDTLKEIRRFCHNLPVIMISGASSPLEFIETRKNGDNDVLAKPAIPDDLRKAPKMIIGTRPLALAATAEQKALPANNRVFLSTSPTMRELQDLTASVGWSDAPVLIQGETGVGKELVARQVHACSPRAKRPMLKLNCAALPSELVESELFGYERGAFTGAFQRKLGMFELADGGTILLDEIGDMDFKLQAKLLQVLQDHEFQRLGGKDTVRVDVRVIAATHRDLERAIAENRFREDLYYRLNVVSLEVPPLRERKEDIPALTDFFVRKHADPGMTDVKLPPKLIGLFLDYHWPGNVRQLENMVRKFLIFRDARLVERDLRGKLARKPECGARSVEATSPAEPQQINVPVPPASASNGTHGAHKNNGTNGTNGASNGHLNPVAEAVTPVLVQVANARRDAERVAILDALRASNWNRRKASLQLQTDYKGLLYKMKVLSIKKEEAVPVPSPDSGELVMSSNQP